MIRELKRIKMKKATNLKLLESEEIKNMSFEDVFLSSQYKYDIQQLSNTAVKRTGCERSPLVRVLNDINDDSVAYTDGNKVTINFGNPFASRLRTNYPVYHIYVVGLLAHELGHIILHSETNSISLNSRTHLCTSKYEREADLFAVNLLLQDETFSTYEGLSVVEISKITHIPLKLITLKYFPE